MPLAVDDWSFRAVLKSMKPRLFTASLLRTTLLALKAFRFIEGDGRRSNILNWIF
jgi:hypothetical protein